MKLRYIGGPRGREENKENMKIMEEGNEVFPWMSLGQPPDGDMWPSSGVGDVGGTSGYDLLTRGTCEALFEVETPFKVSGMDQKAICSDSVLDLNISDELMEELLQDVLPGLPMSPGKLEASVQSQSLSQPPADPNSAEIYFEGLENAGAGLSLGFVTSGVDGDVMKGNGGQAGVPAPVTSTGKTGSQAFDYVGANAILETHGHPAPSHRTFTTFDCDGTGPSKPCGTLSIDPKLTAVSDKITSFLTHSKTCDTLPTDLKLTTVPDKVTSTPGTNTAVSSTPKKRRRRRRKVEGEDGEARKKRLYEHGPLSDAKEERKRKDAIRAKLCRERKSEEVKELRERLAKIERERDQLAKELIGRRSYEKKLLVVLRENYGISVKPYEAHR